MQVLTGCGGWGYFHVPGDRLKAYCQAYDFVEVNTTFYSNPSVQEVRSWRRRAPEGFEFTVKATRVLTHDEALRPTARAVKAFDRMRGVCRELGAKVLVMQTPPSFDTTPGDVRDLIGSVDVNGLSLVWEPRGEFKESYTKLALDLGMTPSVDLSYQEPPGGELLYTRVFGPCDVRKADMPQDIIERVNEKVEGSGAAKVYATFHGSRMYKDAARFLVYRKG